MKKKIFALMLLICISVGSLSSCLLFDLGFSGTAGSPSGSDGDTNINVEGGPSYENITINSSHDKNLLAASKAVLSSVSIICGFEEYKYSFSGVPTGTKETASAGSGVIYKLDKEKGDAYVITNYHVIHNANSTSVDGISRNINLYLYGMENLAEGDVSYAIPATYVGGSMNYDIAVLKVTASKTLIESNARAVDIADSDDVTILDTAIAVGNPGGGGLSATVGNVNVDSENIAIRFDTADGAVAVSLRVMRTDAAVNSGNSGGGLFNDSGELIGIVNAKNSDTTVDNIGYAIPSNVARAIADNAIHYSDGTIKRCMLGITVGVKKYSTDYNLETGKIRRLEEVVISNIADGAAAAEYLKVGYVINSITVDGVTQEVTRVFHVVDSMLAARVGSAVTINITDTDGTTRDVIIPITENMLTNY